VEIHSHARGTEGVGRITIAGRCHRVNIRVFEGAGGITDGGGISETRSAGEPKTKKVSVDVGG
jgi:hypothetical protein